LELALLLLLLLSDALFRWPISSLSSVSTLYQDILPVLNGIISPLPSRSAMLLYIAP
jgi:hypothetical protein